MITSDDNIEDNNNDNEISLNSIKLEESCDQMSNSCNTSSVKTIDSGIGVTTDDPIGRSDANQKHCVDNNSVGSVGTVDSESMDKSVKPQIPAKTFKSIPRSVDKRPISSSDVTKQVVAREESVPDDEQEVPNDESSAKESSDLSENFEKSVDIDNNAVDDMFNKVFGKSVTISDQISEIEVEDSDNEELEDNDTKQEVKEVIKEETNEQIKEQVNEDIKEQINEDIKDQVKEDVKEQVKEVVKESVNEDIIEETTEEIDKEINEQMNESKTSEEISKHLYPDDKNPFGDEEEDEEEDNETKEEDSNKNLKHNKSVNEYPDDKNPFGDEEETEHLEEVLSRNQSSVRIRLRTPSDALNPFADEDDDKDVSQPEMYVTPKPKPRQSLVATSSPSSAVSSPTSSVRSRKKRPAPTPPTPATPSSTSNTSQTPTTIPQVNSSCSLNSSFAVSGESSRRDSVVSSLDSELSSLPNSRTPTPLPRHRRQKSAEELSDSADSHERISHKSDMNSSVRSNDTIDSDIETKNRSASDLRPAKKRPAPPIPAVKRTIKGSLAEIETELISIGDRLPVIEKRSQVLEEMLLKSRTEVNDNTVGQEVSAEESKSASNGEQRQLNEAKAKHEELMNEFLSNARERCRLARRQKELMYMKREHKLEEIQADIEYQMRCVISKQAAQKTDDDKKNEEELLKRLVEIIEERNDIVENMITDENKEVEEYRKLVSRVIPTEVVKEVDANANKSEPKISKHKTIDKNLIKLKEKLKLKEIKEKKKLKKLKETDKSCDVSKDKSEDNGSEAKTSSLDSQPKSKPEKHSSKHLTLKSTLKPFRKSLGLKSSSDKKSNRNNQSIPQSMAANNDTKPSETSDHK